MKIPAWTPEAKPQPTELVDAIAKRRGGDLLNLDRVLLWSEPIARGWNVYMKHLRQDLSTSAKLRELAICTVALLTGAHYEYHHHAPEFRKAGGNDAELEALSRAVAGQPENGVNEVDLGLREQLVVQWAAQMTRQIKVNDALFEKLRQHFDTTEIVEITTTIASYNMVARILLTTGVQPE
ncbi:MAG: carboxymuconolactone decarboxylase family protein [Alphaproteobacteria bacterium]|nr:carboxymuconolactone decarboxylase family protein [Alphaproteobacteria bacterium]MDI9329916.1 carboxymuconolactone decarboxylase family protein [Alphaproteobacteria bacterium]